MTIWKNFKEKVSSLRRLRLIQLLIPVIIFLTIDPFLTIKINKTNKKPKSGQDLNNLQSILRIGSSNCVNSNDLGSECIWIKQDSSTYTNSLLFDKEIDNFLSKKYFYLDEVYSNLVDLKKNENYLEMKKSKQQQTSGLISQDKQIVRSSSLAAAKNKLNKKVDFLDLKLNNCLNKSKKSENNSLPSSSQSSPKSTLSNQHSNEDSFVDSNFSSSSSEMIQPSKSSKKLSSLSSTSSGVGSSNVSSASSTTSESSSADFASSKLKKAPKAIISDDGDIEIENPNNCSKIPKPVEPPSRSSMRIIDQSVYKNEAKKYNNIYYVNAKNSMCLNNRCSQPSTPLQSAYHHQTFYQNQLAAAAAAAAAATTKANWTAKNSCGSDPNWISAPASYCGGQVQVYITKMCGQIKKDKEKQRDALMEYFKNQQLQEHLQKYSKNEMPNESLRSLSKQIGLEISCKMKNEVRLECKNPSAVELWHKLPRSRTQSASQERQLFRMFSFLNKKSSKKSQNESKLDLNGDTQFGSLRSNKSKKKSKQPEADSDKSSKKNASYFSSGYFTTGRMGKKKCSNSLGLCYLIYGPETKRTLLPSQVTGIDTVKALFVRAFAEKLTMGYLDDEKCVKIYIKDQIKDLFYQLDDMNDIKDKCVLKLVDISNAQPSNKMTQSQYCYSNLSEHQSATIDEKSSEKVPACPRSLSEPRIQIKKAAAPKPTYQNPIYNHPCQEYILTNQDLMNQTLNSNVETYDNLDGQSAHQSRIESKYVLPAPLSYHDRYNRSLNPIYNSMRIESRDAKSVDRDAVYKNGASAALKSEPPTPQLSRQSTINEHSFAQSVAAPKTKIGGADIDATEDDTISLPSSISARGFKNFHADFSKNLDSTEYDVECDDDEKTVNEENVVESCENSKLKMKLMQKQLETLTNLVHQALINKDLNRLEGIAHTAKFNQSRLMPMDVNKSSIGLLNDQAKQLKNDLNAIKKMHANFNFVVGESFREFVDQINDKLRGLCANEKNQNSRIDCLVNRYNSDFSKIENEL
ncbi:Actin interacting 3, partial [Brachionus plicatilis]